MATIFYRVNKFLRSKMTMCFTHLATSLHVCSPDFNLTVSRMLTFSISTKVTRQEIQMIGSSDWCWVCFEALTIHFQAWVLWWRLISVFLGCFTFVSLGKQYVKVILKMEDLKKLVWLNSRCVYFLHSNRIILISGIFLKRHYRTIKCNCQEIRPLRKTCYQPFKLNKLIRVVKAST